MVVLFLVGLIVSPILTWAFDLSAWIWGGAWLVTGVSMLGMQESGVDWNWAIPGAAIGAFILAMVIVFTGGDDHPASHAPMSDVQATQKSESTSNAAPARSSTRSSSHSSAGGASAGGSSAGNSSSTTSSQSWSDEVDALGDCYDYMDAADTSALARNGCRAILADDWCASLEISISYRREIRQHTQGLEGLWDRDCGSREDSSAVDSAAGTSSSGFTDAESDCIQYAAMQYTEAYNANNCRQVLGSGHCAVLATAIDWRRGSGQHTSKLERMYSAQC